MAAVFGAVLVVIIFSIVNEAESGSTPSLATLAAAGAVVGAGVQVGVRLTGVS